MTNDLATALTRAGHQVQVVHLDWFAGLGVPQAPTQTVLDGVSVLSIKPFGFSHFSHALERTAKWIVSPFRAALAMRRMLRSQSFDLLVAFSPLTAMAAPVVWATRHFKTKNYLIQWDFFPYHHRSIGLMPRGLPFLGSRSIEQSLMRRFHVVGCLSEKSVAFLKLHYHLRPTQKLEVLPIWGRTSSPPSRDRAEVRKEFDLPLDTPIAVFGGQLSEGRGLEGLLHAASLAVAADLNVKFLIIGSGRLQRLVAGRANSNCANVLWRDRIPRHSYLTLISACDVAIVCTEKNVCSPTFPSKTIDYLRAGLPIAAWVENSTDYGQFIEANQLGVSVLGDDPHVFLNAVRRLLQRTKNENQKAAQRALREIFDVDLAARQLINSV